MPGDAESIAQIEEELFPENWMGESSVLNGLARGPAFVAITEEGTVVGYALTEYYDGLLDLLRLGVTRIAQGLGLGRALLQEVTDVHHRECMLTVRKDNLAALHLYKSSGFSLHGDLGEALVLIRSASRSTPDRS